MRLSVSCKEKSALQTHFFMVKRFSLSAISVVVVLGCRLFGIVQVFSQSSFTNTCGNSRMRRDNVISQSHFFRIAPTF